MGGPELLGPVIGWGTRQEDILPVYTVERIERPADN